MPHRQISSPLSAETAQRRRETAQRHSGATAQGNGATVRQTSFYLGGEQICYFFTPFLGPLSIYWPLKNGAAAQPCAVCSWCQRGNEDLTFKHLRGRRRLGRTVIRVETYTRPIDVIIPGRSHWR